MPTITGRCSTASRSSRSGDRKGARAELLDVEGGSGSERDTSQIVIKYSTLIKLYHHLSYFCSFCFVVVLVVQRRTATHTAHRAQSQKSPQPRRARRVKSPEESRAQKSPESKSPEEPKRVQEPRRVQSPTAQKSPESTAHRPHSPSPDEPHYAIYFLRIIYF